ncbi:hypothetical protein pb186bvf_008759 [Paramecium bursaria]
MINECVSQREMRPSSRVGQHLKVNSLFGESGHLITESRVLQIKGEILEKLNRKKEFLNQIFVQMFDNPKFNRSYKEKIYSMFQERTVQRNHSFISSKLQYIFIVFEGEFLLQTMDHYNICIIQHGQFIGEENGLNTNQEYRYVCQTAFATVLQFSYKDIKNVQQFIYDIDDVLRQKAQTKCTLTNRERYQKPQPKQSISPYVQKLTDLLSKKKKILNSRPKENSIPIIGQNFIQMDSLDRKYMLENLDKSNVLLGLHMRRQKQQIQQRIQLKSRSQSRETIRPKSTLRNSTTDPVPITIPKQISQYIKRRRISQFM